MRTVSGSLNSDWTSLVPGDLVVSCERICATWPPDGTRTRMSGTICTWVPDLKSRIIEANEPFTIVSHARRESKGVFRWWRSTQSILLYRDRLWWVGTSTSGSVD